jgi:hypothetical protein
MYRGVLTGLNEAFVVDRATRDALITEHASSAEVLKPFLRGRDVKRWKVESKDLWLVFTRQGIDIQKYPAILRHLTQYRTQLEPKPRSWQAGEKWEGRKPGPYKWYEIQDNIAYYREFEEGKILLGRFMDGPLFCFDRDGYFCNNALSIIAGAEEYLVAVLNSQVAWWFLVQISTILQNGYLQAHNYNLEQIPVPDLKSQAAKDELSALANAVARGQSSEEALNRKIFSLFSLTEAEIALIRKDLDGARSTRESSMTESVTESEDGDVTPPAPKKRGRPKKT